ncbi:methyl-accepting chemotaxis protein [Rhodoferax sp.]|uniref:methyl-accepting chemotaxis protein n=1 Tax=Rhodoferax sp. TaxID=50421 RepID=UPI002842AB21|nr:methyl-accepting chemotaxis protein [Rhodoferax sp.]MDR3369127.1 methyl-accepting chemotaxis protein [Rhodoferax sp.]
MSINTKLLLTIAATLFGLIMVSGLTLMEEKSTLLDDRKASTRNEVETAYGLLTYYHERQKKGDLTEAQAQRAALDHIRTLRYGDNEYFWVNDMNNRMLMHPVKPEMEGNDYSDLKDANGKLFFREFSQLVRKSGSGFVAYAWPKPGFTKPVGKISYTKGFEPWGWVLCSGIYLDDVDALFREKATHVLGFIAAIVLAIAALLLMTGRKLVRRIDMVVAGVNRVAHGDLTKDINDANKDEIGQLAQAANEMRNQLHNLATQLNAHARQITLASTEIDEAVGNQASTSTQMSSSVAEITSTVEELSASSTQIADHSKAVVDIANQTLENSRLGSAAMQTVLAHVSDIRSDNQSTLREIVELGAKSKEISKIMAMIDTIAGQTKLIAFNAALEASSAGEAGKRFSVVAGEIRRLADSVTESTGEIETKTNEIQDAISRLVITSEKGAGNITAGLTASTATAAHLTEIVNDASHTSNAAQQISLSTQQQKIASNQVAVALREIVSASAHTAQSITRISQISKDMSELSARLNGLVRQFKLSEKA